MLKKLRQSPPSRKSVGKIRRAFSWPARPPTGRAYRFIFIVSLRFAPPANAHHLSAPAGTVCLGGNIDRAGSGS